MQFLPHFFIASIPLEPSCPVPDNTTPIALFPRSFAKGFEKNQPKPHMTIDYFFESLAKERGNKAIGVVLSGTGHDGSKGIEAIKNAGGIALVQEPESASFKETPATAIATGCVDIILTGAMPKIIEEYVLDKGQLKFGDNSGKAVIRMRSC